MLVSEAGPLQQECGTCSAAAEWWCKVGEFYEDSWLIDTGVTLHLGHGGKLCPSYHQEDSSYNCHDIPFGLPDLPPELDDQEDGLDLDSTSSPYMEANEDEDFQAMEESEDVAFLDPHNQEGNIL